MLQKHDAEGKKIWYVRLHHEGKERRFGSFSTKTQARDFYNKAKVDQKTGRFFPERYQHGGYELLTTVIDRCTAVSTVKNQSAEKNYARWWKSRLEGKRVNAITPAVIEAVMRELSAKNLAPQTVLHYLQISPAYPQHGGAGRMAGAESVCSGHAPHGEDKTNSVFKFRRGITTPAAARADLWTVGAARHPHRLAPGGTVFVQVGRSRH